ncbi:uncharacterized protein [Gossypium hirsutum]|uniref:Uncharacterized protein n=1 Tax=Gossypium hirsutum TaxID=3635 RepID=A0A1U8P2F1_GOSHI|nr:uncharacterized protein LOC107954355 [Gossypium hirsutum]XP_016745379.2 uncharacterized protein LOC107954355 [Gossypium hirsutum]
MDKSSPKSKNPELGNQASFDRFVCFDLLVSPCRMIQRFFVNKLANPNSQGFFLSFPPTSNFNSKYCKRSVMLVLWFLFFLTPSVSPSNSRRWSHYYSEERGIPAEVRKKRKTKILPLPPFKCPCMKLHFQQKTNQNFLVRFDCGMFMYSIYQLL